MEQIRFSKKILHSTFYILRSCRKGQSLVEVLVAVAIGALFVIAAITIIAPAINVSSEAGKIQTGTALARQLLDNVRTWADGDWHNVLNMATSSANKYYLSSSTSPFSSISGQESVKISTTTYTRFFYFDDVYRDVSDLVVTSGGSYDPSTKKVTIVYKWPPINATHTLSAYITRSANRAFWQTDWFNGPGQNGPVTTTNSGFSTSSNIDYTTSSGSIYIKLN